MFKYLSILMIVFSMVLAADTPAIMAQAPLTKQEKKIAKIKEKLQKLGTGTSAKVKIKTYSGTTITGHMDVANADDFTVIDKGMNPHTIRYSEVDQIGGKNLSTGAKIGIGIGIGAGAVIAILALLFASLND